MVFLVPRLAAIAASNFLRTLRAVGSHCLAAPALVGAGLFVSISFLACGWAVHNVGTRVVGYAGAFAVDLCVVWLLVRFVAKTLLFPGSSKLFQRNTEATFRSELARQYVHYLRQLRTFLKAAASKDDSPDLKGVSVCGLTRACSIVEGLSNTFQIQLQHQVKLSGEQQAMHETTRDLDQWLRTTQVRAPPVPAVEHSAPRDAWPSVPVAEWLRRLASRLGTTSQGARSRTDLVVQALLSAELTADSVEVEAKIAKLDWLLETMEDLRQAKSTVFQTVRRFVSVPTVGSLNQLRTELQVRYQGQHIWVPTRRFGHRLDCMLLPALPRGDVAAADLESRQELIGARPVVIWCSPNAAYYETMVYQSAWLDFWLTRGISLFIFNYSGYGRSTGSPSPSRLVADGDAIVRYLKSRGATRIGVYGRSIGGVPACHIARHHADVVQLLVADRTMSELGSAAKHLYGGWASKGLTFAKQVHGNLDNFWQARCYKLLVVDPKDGMILDPAALRTAVALRVVEQMRPSDRGVEDANLRGFAETWKFLTSLISVCDAADAEDVDLSRSAREPALREDPELVAIEASNLRGSVPLHADFVASTQIDRSWLLDNGPTVRATIGPFAHRIRSALGVVCENLQGGGVTLLDVFTEYCDPVMALRGMLANMQVWGNTTENSGLSERLDVSQDDNLLSLGPQQAAKVQPREIEEFLSREVCVSSWGSSGNLEPNAAEILTPDMLSDYQRRLARQRVAAIGREFQRRCRLLQQALATCGGDVSSPERSSCLVRAVLRRMAEVEAFVSAVGRTLKDFDRQMEGAGGSQPDGAQAAEQPLEGKSDAPPPRMNQAAAGHIMHIDCGHNGLLEEPDLRVLALHLRACKFAEPPQQ